MLQVSKVCRIQESRFRACGLVGACNCTAGALALEVKWFFGCRQLSARPNGLVDWASVFVVSDTGEKTMCGKNNHADIDSRFDGNGAHTHTARRRDNSIIVQRPLLRNLATHLCKACPNLPCLYTAEARNSIAGALTGTMM